MTCTTNFTDQISKQPRSFKKIENWEVCPILTALKASSRLLWVGLVTVLLDGVFLDCLLDEGFLFSDSAAGGTCSLFCFFPIFSKPSYRVSDIFRGAEGNKAVVVKTRLCAEISQFSNFFCLLQHFFTFTLWMKLILETKTFRSPHIQGFHPPSVACVMSCYNTR